MFVFRVVFACIMCGLLLIMGCARFENQTALIHAQYNLNKYTVETALFNHVVFSNNVRKNNKIHIYIGGDGTPWIKGQWVSGDPTPSNPLTLRLMAMDSHYALLIGRPCYFGQVSQKGCTSDMWTGARYSTSVVDSMEAAVREVSNDSNEIVLFGYSGGAVVASLLADRLPNVVAVVTVAGNLDIDAWTRYRGFLPLDQSINPVDHVYLRPNIRFIHLTGGGDTNVPPHITELFVKKHGGTIWHYPDFGHNCCWESQWPKILGRLERSPL
jgi:hypothetical protein